MKKNVLITGASSGIGLSFAEVFASKGYNLILVARNKEKLEEIQKKFVDNYKVEIGIHSVDISKKDLLEELWITIEKSYPQIDILINNAGAGFNGEFTDIEWEKHEQIIDLNIKSLTRLNYLAINHMRKNKCGKILNVASTGAYQAGPLIGVYYATKAYVLSLSTALREEVKNENIIISTICPGATKTAFSKRAGKEDLNVAMSPDLVASIGYRGLMKNKDIIIPGIMNKCAVLASRLLPYTFTAKMVKSIQGGVIKNK